MIKLQFTVFCTNGKYRPISTLVDVESLEYYKTHAKEVQKRALQKICAQRYVDGSWLKDNDYTSMKVRIYDKEKIEAARKMRYEAIKKERGWV